MRVAVFGGSFNPPHVAHGMVAAWLLWTGQADEVWLVPVFRHAFEGLQDKRLAPFELRLRWCAALAADVDPRIRVSDVEAHLPTPSFTIMTLRHIAASFPEHQLRLVVGADVLPQLPKWKDWDAIREAFSPVVVGRHGHPGPEGTVDFPDVSSTELRVRLREGRPVDHLVTRSVAALLREGGSAPWGGQGT